MLTEEQVKECFTGTKRGTAARLVEFYPHLGTVAALRKNKRFCEIFDAVIREVNQDSLLELLERKGRDFERKRVKDSRQIYVKRLSAMPVAILHFGDPHLDSDGCNFQLLRSHVKAIAGRKNVWAGNVGDTTDNWVGRLMSLYAKAHTTVDEAILLSEWFISSVPWLYFIMGNHDYWNQGDAILSLLLRNAQVYCKGGRQACVSLEFDNGVKVNIKVRHDFRGRSQYHSTHGALKHHLLGDRWADLLVSGHTHEWGLLQNETEDGKPRWALKVAGYKYYDDYADEKGFYRHEHGSSCLTVINPFAHPPNRIMCFWEVKDGLEYLDLLSDRYNKSSSSICTE